MLRAKFDKLMTELGYAEAIQGKTDREVVEMIEEEFVPLSEIDESQPFELMKYDIYDIFWEKHWIHLPTLIAEDKLERLYHLLCDFKRARGQN